LSKYHTPSGMYITAWHHMRLDLYSLLHQCPWSAYALSALCTFCRLMQLPFVPATCPVCWIVPLPASLFAFEGLGVLQCVLVPLLYPAGRGFCRGLCRTCGCLLLSWCTAPCPLSCYCLRLVLLRAVLGAQPHAHCGIALCRSGFEGTGCTGRTTCRYVYRLQKSGSGTKRYGLWLVEKRAASCRLFFCGCRCSASYAEGFEQLIHTTCFKISKRHPNHFVHQCSASC
jgi:hypothetical protein